MTRGELFAYVLETIWVLLVNFVQFFFSDVPVLHVIRYMTLDNAVEMNWEMGNSTLVDIFLVDMNLVHFNDMARRALFIFFLFHYHFLHSLNANFYSNSAASYTLPVWNSLVTM